MEGIQGASPVFHQEKRGGCHALLRIIKKIFRAIGRFFCCKCKKDPNVHHTGRLTRAQLQAQMENTLRAAAVAVTSKQISRVDSTATINLCGDSEIDLNKVLQVGFRNDEGVFLPADMRFCAKIPSCQKRHFSKAAQEGVAECDVYFLVFQALGKHHRLGINIPGSVGQHEIALFSRSNVAEQFLNPIPVNAYQLHTVCQSADTAAFNWDDEDKVVEFEFGQRSENRSILAHVILLPQNIGDLSLYTGEKLNLSDPGIDQKVKNLFAFQQTPSAR